MSGIIAIDLKSLGKFIGCQQGGRIGIPVASILITAPDPRDFFQFAGGFPEPEQRIATRPFLAFLDACIILVLGNLVFGMPILGSIFLLLLESFLYICMALSLGILISSITNSQQVAMLLSLVALMLPTILLSGFVFPVENMPWILQVLCHIMPPKYYITIIKSIMLQGNGIAYVWRETLVLAGFTSLFLAISIKKFNVRLA